MTELKEEKATPVANGKLSGMPQDHWSTKHQELKPHSNIKNKSRICTLSHQSNLLPKRETNFFINSIRQKHLPVSSRAGFAKVSIRTAF